MRHLNAMTKLHRMLGQPRLGGRLTIVNCAAWAICVLSGIYRGNLSIAYTHKWILILLSSPVAVWFLPDINRHRYYPDRFTVIFISIMIGLNSLAWGYGLSWLLRTLHWTTPW